MTVTDPPAGPPQPGSHAPAGRLGLGPGVAPVATVVILGTAMTLLDSTIVNIALHTLTAGLHSPLGTIQWTVTAYLLAVAAVIPGTGWAAERYGARRVYLLSVAIFGAGSALCGLAGSAGYLIFFRAIQGIGGGMVLPVGQIILVRRAGPQNLPRVMSLIGVPIVLAPVFGPTVGGLIIEYASWHWIFFVNVPVSIVTILFGRRLLPRDQGRDVGMLDFAGLLLAAGGTVAVTYGLAVIGITGRADAWPVIVALAAGFALLAVFGVRALRVERPVLDIRLYRQNTFAASAVTMLCIGAALYGGAILMPLYYQTVRSQSVVATGLLLAPSGIGAAVANWLSGRLTEKIGAGLTSVLGGVVAMLATVPFGLITAGTSYAELCATTTVRGFGVGLTMMPAMTAAYRKLKRDQISHATPQLSVLRQVGGSIGTAIFTVVLTGGLKDAGASHAAQAHAYGTAFWWVITVTALATLPAVVLAVLERRERDNLAESVHRRSLVRLLGNQERNQS